VVVPHVDDVAALAAALREAIAGPVDVVIDPVFGAAATAALQVLGVGGRLVNLGGSAGDTATFSSSALRSRSLSVLGYTNNSLSVAQRAEAITAVAALAGAGELRVAHVAQPLDLVADAWVATQTGRAAPRPVLVP
jgi:NADPH:quinone reductase-like Zn-dependent oxidoreductase